MTLLALAIFILTIVLVVWQPRNLGIGWSALFGAALALITGVVELPDVLAVWNIVWDATFTFVALVIISLILDKAGFFSWAALHIARIGNGRGRRLFPLIVLLGAIISAFFANDGAALLLTPIVIAILLRLEFTPGATLAFILATGFIADTASLPLVISNLVNIVSANYFDISFAEYAAVMVPVNVVSVVATLVVLWIVFGRDIPRTYDVSALPAPRSLIVDFQVFRAAFPLLVMLLITYFTLARFAVPFSIITGAAAVTLFVIAARFGQREKPVLALGSIWRDAPWQIVLFSVGMYLVVFGLAEAGLTALGVSVLEWLATTGPTIATVGTGIFSALLASVMNNMPATLAVVLAIEAADVSGTMQQLMVYANVVGNDLGPKLTPIGSLATLLWLHVLAGKGFRVGWGQYVRIGFLLTPPVLIATLLALAWWLPRVG